MSTLKNFIKENIKKSICYILHHLNELLNLQDENIECMEYHIKSNIECLKYVMKNEKTYPHMDREDGFPLFSINTSCCFSSC